MAIFGFFLFCIIGLIIYQIITTYFNKDSYLIEISTISNLSKEDESNSNIKDTTKLFDFINKNLENSNRFTNLINSFKSILFDKIFIFIMSSLALLFIQANDFISPNILDLNANRNMYYTAMLIVFSNVLFLLYGTIMIIEIQLILKELTKTNHSKNEFSNVSIKSSTNISNMEDSNFFKDIISEFKLQLKMLNNYLDQYSIWLEFKEKYNSEFSNKENSNIFSSMIKSKSKSDKRLFYILTVINSILSGIMNGFVLILTLFYFSFTSSYSYKILTFLLISFSINFVSSFGFGYFIRNTDFEDKISNSEYQNLITNIHEDEV